MKITCNVRLYRGYVYFTAVTEEPGTDWCFNTKLNIIQRNHPYEDDPHFEEIIGSNDPAICEDESVTRIPEGVVDEINSAIINGHPIETIEIEVFEWIFHLN